MNTKFLNQLKESKTPIKCASGTEKRAVADILVSLGETVNSCTFQPGLNMDMNYPYVRYVDDKCGWDGDSNLKGDISFVEFVAKIFAPEKTTIEVPLNLAYTAEYSKGSAHITVGCQKFPVKSLVDLIAEINTLNNA